MIISRTITALLFLGLSVFLACQGRPSENTPIHLNPDMDQQPKYEPQENSHFFADSATMRTPVAGTVARGQLRADAIYYFGKSGDGALVDEIPVQVNMNLLRRGQDRYDIFCAPCHSRVGDGRGIMIQRGYVPPPSFHEKRLREVSDGHVFDIITHGIRNMPAYAHQIPVEDRWAVVAYMRALQRSQNADLDDIPIELRDKVK